MQHDKQMRALEKISKFLSFERVKRQYETYIISTFRYSLLILTFCGKTANSLTNKIHNGCLLVVYEMEDANLEDLLITDSSWTIYENNIRTLSINIYKSLNQINNSILQYFFV